MKLNDLVFFLMQIYFIYFFIFLNNWEPYTNIPIGTKGINIFIAIVLFLGVLYTLFYLSYILNVYVLKKEFEIKINSYFIYLIYILLIFSILLLQIQQIHFLQNMEIQEKIVHRLMKVFVHLVSFVQFQSVKK